ncbi:MAG: hypothetical protein QF437_00145 [Planctomycetota bacterium]|jgi:outer membrane PBP1 activator LpoA protein|nr:hypothetical protein [Planctomycetota bacterium]MDP7247992.1 hypothetical protein [Planctomycetota bacterium]
MPKSFEAVAHNGVIVLPEDVPPASRCVVTVMDEDLEDLQIQAAMTIPEDKQQRMGELLFKNREGQLTNEERIELDTLSAEFDAATLKKGRAMSLLAQMEHQEG